MASIRDFQSRMSAAKVALVVNVSRDPDSAAGLGSGRLIDPQAPAAAVDAGDGRPDDRRP